jgi:hypothetical protein
MKSRLIKRDLECDDEATDSKTSELEYNSKYRKASKKYRKA